VTAIIAKMAGGFSFFRRTPKTAISLSYEVILLFQLPQEFLLFFAVLFKNLF
jgi:hypothetical protein